MEKGEGVDIRKKYDVRGYPTLLFLNSSGEVVHRLLGADKASALLEKVKLGVESGGISGLRNAMKRVSVTLLLSADISMYFLPPTVKRGGKSSC